MIRPIVTQVEQLIMPSEPTNDYDCSRNGIWDDMKDTLLSTKSGLALSAIQIGHAVRAFVIIIRHSDPARPTLTMKFCNPKISAARSRFIFPGEGCVSFPGKYIKTERYNEVLVTDDIGEEQDFNGLMAVIVQHEIDHLNGITLYDREWQEDSAVNKGDNRGAK